MSTPKNNRDMYSPTFWDVFLIVSILVFTAAVVFRSSISALQAPSEKKTASVYHEGVLLQRVDLGTNQEIGLLDGKMRIRVEDEKIAVVETHCPRKVCMHMGWIRHPGETILCAPYKIAIEIEAEGDPLVDAVVF